MRIKLADREDTRLRSNNTIPWQYVAYVSAFGTPGLLTSPDLDLVYQDHTIAGCTIRHILYHAKNPVVVAMTIGRAKSVIQCVLHGNLQIQLKDVAPLVCQEGHYHVLRINTEEHLITLQPGITEELRFEYRGEVLREYRDATRVQNWIHEMRQNVEAAAYLDSGEMPPGFFDIYKELKQSSPKDAEQEEWFAAKLRELLQLAIHQEPVRS